MGCPYCNQKRQQLAAQVKSGDIRGAVKTAAVGAGAILGMVDKNPKSERPLSSAPIGTIIGGNKSK